MGCIGRIQMIPTIRNFLIFLLSVTDLLICLNNVKAVMLNCLSKLLPNPDSESSNSSLQNQYCILLKLPNVNHLLIEILEKISCKWNLFGEDQPHPSTDLTGRLLEPFCKRKESEDSGKAIILVNCFRFCMEQGK